MQAREDCDFLDDIVDVFFCTLDVDNFDSHGLARAIIDAFVDLAETAAAYTRSVRGDTWLCVWRDEDHTNAGLFRKVELGIRALSGVVTVGHVGCPTSGLARLRRSLLHCKEVGESQFRRHWPAI